MTALPARLSGSYPIAQGGITNAANPNGDITYDLMPWPLGTRPSLPRCHGPVSVRATTI
ncbi:hypothetical protein [Mesorhizobium sp. M0227]|uniref:hypothetical protein n=1 Tax=unclassified Mesorhizobium TaxID=325217 RepID=UPI003337B959